MSLSKLCKIAISGIHEKNKNDWRKWFVKIESGFLEIASAPK